jgi:type IV secretory pathway VirB10-like protein
MLKITMVTITTFILLQMTAFSDSVYVWTDEKGVKHYSNSGPSELTDDYQKQKELPPNPAQSSATREVSSDAPPPAESRTDSPPDAPQQEKVNTDPEAEFLEATRLNLDDFPQQQGDLVRREKSIVGSLQQELKQPGVNRADVIERERKRLLSAINTLEQAPLEKFGSQNNKRRQVGYYKYRLDELQNNPDAYFKYPQSDTD